MSLARKFYFHISPVLNIDQNQVIQITTFQPNPIILIMPAAMIPKRETACKGQICLLRAALLRGRIESRHLGGARTRVPSKDPITEIRAGGDETRERAIWIKRCEDRLVAMVENPAVALLRRLLRHPDNPLREERYNQHPPRIDRRAIFRRHPPPHPARQNHHDRRPAIRHQQLQHVAFQRAEISRNRYNRHPARCGRDKRGHPVVGPARRAGRINWKSHHPGGASATRRLPQHFAKSGGSARCVLST